MFLCAGYGILSDSYKETLDIIDENPVLQNKINYGDKGEPLISIELKI